MKEYCCVLCVSEIAESNPVAIRIILEHRMTVLSLTKDSGSVGLLLLKAYLKEPDYLKLKRIAEEYLEDYEDTLAFHDRYGQTEELEFTCPSELKATGYFRIGNVLEVIGRKENEGKLRGFLRACADESVKVSNDIASTGIVFSISFDSAIYFSLELESYLVIRATENGTEAMQYDLPYSGTDESTMIYRVGSVLANESRYRTIIIDNIVGVGSDEEKVKMADPLEWMHSLQAYTTLCDKWLIMGMFISNEEPYADCSGPMLQEKINKHMEEEYVHVLNFADSDQAKVDYI